MALSSVGQVTGGEITAINRSTNTVFLELDSAECARLPLGKLKGADKLARFQALKEGMELRVLVVETRDGKFGKPFHTVSENLDEPIEVADEDDDVPEEAHPAHPDPALVIQFPAGRTIKGKFAHMSGDCAIIVLGDVRARLPVSELGSMKVTSLRKGVAVCARVLRVDGIGVVLTRKVAASA